MKRVDVWRALADVAGLLSIVLLAMKLAPKPDARGVPPELARDMADFHARWLGWVTWWWVAAPIAAVLVLPWLWLAVDVTRAAWRVWRGRAARARGPSRRSD